MREMPRKVLATGEATGHAHRVSAEDAEVVGTEDALELEAPTGTPITHEEHKTVTLPPGTYVVSRQRECDPQTAETRRVSD